LRPKQGLSAQPLSAGVNPVLTLIIPEALFLIQGAYSRYEAQPDLKSMHPVLDRLRTLFLKPRPAKLTGDRLYAACVTQSRDPVFYTDYGVEDAIGARFEMLCLHVAMVVLALRAVSADDARHEQAFETGQAVFNAFLLALDHTLREQGVGDLSVPKKMKKLGAVTYTRMKRWEDLWRENAPAEVMADYAARTIFAGSELGEADVEDGPAAAITPEILAFAAYIQEARVALTPAALIAGRADWPAAEPRDAVSAADAEAMEA
jgi:cytochrome b pre-mRNA-processing protein 3